MKDIFPFFDNLSQRQLGEVFGVSSHSIGKWLKELGLRDLHNQPTEQAKTDGLAVRIEAEGVEFYVWDKDRTIELLQEAGHPIPAEKAQQQGNQPPVLVGPFTTRGNEVDGFEVVNADGLVGVWVRGQKNAEIVAKLLTLAHAHGKLGGPT